MDGLVCPVDRCQAAGDSGRDPGDHLLLRSAQAAAGFGLELVGGRGADCSDVESGGPILDGGASFVSSGGDLDVCESAVVFGDAIG